MLAIPQDDFLVVALLQVYSTIQEEINLRSYNSSLPKFSEHAAVFIDGVDGHYILWTFRIGTWRNLQISFMLKFLSKNNNLLYNPPE